MVSIFGDAWQHHAFLFANRRANQMKVLLHDGIGVWLAAQRLNAGRFVWPRDVSGTWSLGRAQFDALELGQLWQRIGDAGVFALLQPRVPQFLVQLQHAPPTHLASLRHHPEAASPKG